MRDHLEARGSRNAVITGAGSGLGRAIALNLARRGWTVGLADVSEDGAVRTLEMVLASGGAGEVRRCDVVDPVQVEEMACHFFERWDGVTLLVNNAGIAVAGLVGEVELTEWKRIVEVNLMGCVNGCHAFVPRMKANGGGYIVNVASFAGMINLPEMAPYNVTKAGVISLSETLRAELAPFGIGVTVACPTFFDTNLLDGMSCTDGFQAEFARSAFRCAKVTSGGVAAAILDGARKGKLYVMPQPAARWSWLAKRFSPTLMHRAMGFGCRIGFARPFIMWMSRRGWL